VSRGRHAAADGSFGRSAGSAALRGAVLIAAAVLLGIVLLRATDSPEPFADIESGGGATTTTTADTEATSTSTTAATRSPAEVKVLVANGSDVAGAAGRVKDELAAKNYNVLAATDATGTASASVVYFNEGFEAEAAALAAQFPTPPAVQPMPAQPPVSDLRGADVLVVIAADLARAG
jgi:hypothetical protein